MPVEDVAEYFLLSVEEEVGDSMSLHRLQMLLFYAQGHYAAHYNSCLFDTELRLEDNVPVFPSIVAKYGDEDRLSPTSDGVDLSSEITEFLNLVWLDYGQYATWKLHRIMLEDLEKLEGDISLVALRDYFQ